MKIAIASDIHDNLANLEIFLGLVKKEKIKIIILCGDSGGKEVLKFLRKNFKKEVCLALGNADKKEEILEFAKNFPNIKAYDNFGEIKIGKLKIAFCHSPKLARKLTKLGNYDFIFYGHTHKPWLEKTENCILANPGNLAGVFFKSTFAILDTKTKKLSLKELF